MKKNSCNSIYTGANWYVMKPFTPAQIYRALDNVLGANTEGGGAFQV